MTAVPPTSQAEAVGLQDVALLLTRVGARLRGCPDHSLAQAVVDTTVDVVPHARWSSITVLHRGRFKSLVVTDDIASRIDAVQYQAESGPCVDAVEEDNVFVSGDLCTDARWPVFGEAACRAGVRSVLAHRLNLIADEPDAVAALNVYSDVPDAFGEDAVWMGTVLATHAALGVSLAVSMDNAENLRAALRTNRTIGMSMGVLMARHGVTDEQAFDLLRVASQHTNRKLVDIAHEVVATGVLPLPQKSGNGGGKGARVG